MYQSILKIMLALIGLTAGCTYANEFKLKSTDISQGVLMKDTFEFNGFGCSGANKSPQLSWSGAPKGTQAYAIMAYDPDAPTGSGWWHWQVVNIPVEVTSVPSGDGKIKAQGVINVRNDYGQQGFGGACPPQGHGVHRYQFTVYALSKKLELPVDASGALTGYMVKVNALASSTIEAHYKR
ncbi:YbhB/YbcL family Raf kinase inhibitor-like protein [Acinetobacter sp. ME22]|uniref:YbhB/YbcL family Raf kinase inhibitor-like protein n=1 Tax=Acinetobacter sp. ME22 TaxID=2904802 RepID=UPI001EDB6021|nr:YbhB/YbcL family Raf kinase inhibitor-like protein [Acinetobacter sp. ME22]MCG2573158.1 YbhB/YbcL family Raf kinase inhibitor-like protein [Acinetobacter sp. ME22]